MGYEEENMKAIDSWIEEGWEWGKPISEQEFLDAKEGKFSLFLTPTKPIPHHWLLPIKGKKVLGLAAGGAQQIPILSALGAHCALMDLNGKQIASDMDFALKHGYGLDIKQASFTEEFPFKDNTFDMVVNPVSLVYAEELEPIYEEIARVLKPNGVLLIGLDNGVNFLTDENEEKIVFTYPFNPLVHEDQMRSLRESDAGVQFSHGLQESIGGLLRNGFVIEDIFEDTNGEGRLHEMKIPSFYVLKARLKKE